MSVINVNEIPDHILARMTNRSERSAALFDQLRSGLASGGEMVPRISLKGARFRIKDGDAETVLDSTFLDVVIVGANSGIAKNYYAKAYDASAEATGPDCSSLDGIYPVADAPHPQSDTCASCPMNVWGSKITPQGQKIKACSDSKRLAIVSADNPDGPVYMLIVTASVLKDFMAYLTQLGRRGLSPEMVRTRLAFDPNASYPKLTFALAGYLDEGGLSTIDAVLEDPRVKVATGASQLAALPAPKAAPKPLLVAPKEEPVKAAPAAGGFGVAAAPKPAPKAAPKPEPVAAPIASGNDLAAEIEALMAGGSTDDA